MLCIPFSAFAHKQVFLCHSLRKETGDKIRRKMCHRYESMRNMAQTHTNLSNRSLELGRRLLISHSAAHQLTTRIRGELPSMPLLPCFSFCSTQEGRRRKGAALRASHQVRETRQGLILETNFTTRTQVVSMLKWL